MLRCNWVVISVLMLHLRIGTSFTRQIGVFQSDFVRSPKLCLSLILYVASWTALCFTSSVICQCTSSVEMILLPLLAVSLETHDLSHISAKQKRKGGYLRRQWAPPHTHTDIMSSTDCRWPDPDLSFLISESSHSYESVLFSIIILKEIIHLCTFKYECITYDVYMANKTL